MSLLSILFLPILRLLNLDYHWSCQGFILYCGEVDMWVRIVHPEKLFWLWQHADEQGVCPSASPGREHGLKRWKLSAPLSQTAGPGKGLSAQCHSKKRKPDGTGNFTGHRETIPGSKEVRGSGRKDSHTWMFYTKPSKSKAYGYTNKDGSVWGLWLLQKLREEPIAQVC